MRNRYSPTPLPLKISLPSAFGKCCIIRFLLTFQLTYATHIASQCPFWNFNVNSSYKSFEAPQHREVKNRYGCVHRRPSRRQP